MQDGFLNDYVVLFHYTWECRVVVASSVGFGEMFRFPLQARVNHNVVVLTTCKYGWKLMAVYLRKVEEMQIEPGGASYKD